jgi:hypothetical protein
MANRNGRIGTAWESEIVRTLIEEGGWAYAERRRLSGRYDRGDIAGIPGVVIEAKAEKKFNLSGWLKEAHEERDNDHADLGFVWFKRRGKARATDGFVLMDGRTVMMLLTAAGYGGGQ